MIITCSTSGVIDSIHKSLTISTTLNERETSLVFQTTTQLQDYETITVQRNDNTVMFSGILERIKLDNRRGGKIYTVRAIGLVKLFDMKRIARTYNSMTAQEIVEDIVDRYCAGFTATNVTGSIPIERAQFNHERPSDAIRHLAESIGYSWYIDNSKDVHFFEKTTNAAPMTIEEGNDFHNLILEPDTREVANAIIVRGGTYISTTQTYEEIADGTKTQFDLPEKPKDVAVFVSTDSGANFVPKTIAPQFGTTTATSDFQVNYNERYIQNGTHATLNSGDIIRVQYKFDVPVRILRKDQTSIDALKLLFPDTDGEFYKVIENKEINSVQLAEQLGDETLATHSNAKLNGSFNTYTHNFQVGDILTINYKGYIKDVVITKIDAKNNGNDLFIYSIQFATVLFGFEDFLRSILFKTKIDLSITGDVEIIKNVYESISFSETVNVSTDSNRQNETIELSEQAYLELNKEVEYVLGPYFPTGFTDPKRTFILDRSTLGASQFVFSDDDNFVFSDDDRFIF